MPVNLEDIVTPLEVGGGQNIWLKAPMYCSGGQMVLTKDQVSAIGMSILEAPNAAGQQVSYATVDLKDTEGIVYRNRQFSGADATEQLPLMTTRLGRVLVNAPSLVPDADVGPYQFRVYGGLRADAVTCDELVVGSVRTLDMHFIKNIDVLADNSIVLTREDDSQSVLPLTWDMISDKPALEATVAYLQGRMQLAQFNIDFLLAENARVRDDVASLTRAKVLQDQQAAHQAEDFSQRILQSISDQVTAVREKVA